MSDGHVYLQWVQLCEGVTKLVGGQYAAQFPPVGQCRLTVSSPP